MTTYRDLHTPELLDAYIERITMMLLTILDRIRLKVSRGEHDSTLILDCQQFNFMQREYREALEEKDRRAANTSLYIDDDINNIR